jgi:hypothetical protein
MRKAGRATMPDEKRREGRNWNSAPRGEETNCLSLQSGKSVGKWGNRFGGLLLVPFSTLNERLQYSRSYLCAELKSTAAVGGNVGVLGEVSLPETQLASDNHVAVLPG